MEPDDNFALINSYNVEELQPRQLPTAVSYNQVTPIPMVPDVSLVFDGNKKDFRNLSSRRPSNPEPLREDRINSQKSDGNGPRKVKPIPIAPLPNETYGSWRARTISAQSSIGSRLPEANFNSSNVKPDGDGIADRFLAIKRLRETPNIPYCENLNLQKTGHEAALPVLDINTNLRSNGQICNQKLGKRIIEVTRSHQQKEPFANECEIPSNQTNPFLNKPVMSGTFQRITGDYHGYPKSTSANREEEDNCSASNEYQPSQSHPVSLKEKHGNNKSSVHDQMNLTNYPHQVGPAIMPKELVDKTSEPNGLGETLLSQKEASIKKRDAIRDLYRIVQLQNEQLKSLQAQVEKLLKRDVESPRVAAATRSTGMGSGVRYIDEGTQTLSDTAADKSSVGVMTSFMDSSKAYSGDSAAENNPDCKCKGCHCGTASSEMMTNGMDSKERNLQEPNPRKYMGVVNNPISQKYDRPSSVNTRKVQQVIEEEDESDKSSQRLNEDTASHTREIDHQNSKTNDQQSNDGRGCKASLNKPLSNGSSAGKSSKGNGGLEGGKVVRRSPNLETGSQDRKKNQERNRQKCKPLENQKNGQEHNIVNQRALVSKNQQNDDDMTMTLNGVDLQTVTEPQLSPEPSIHVDIQDYHEFSGDVDLDDDSYYSEDSNSDSGEEENLEDHQINPTENEDGDQESRNAKPGWTFYNNVLGQVNKLLEDQKLTHLPPASREEKNKDAPLPTPESADLQSSDPATCLRLPRTQPQPPDSNNQGVMTMPTLEVVRQATLQHLRTLGIDLCSDEDNRFPLPMQPNHIPNPGLKDFRDNRRVTFDANSNRGRSAREMRSTDTSLRIKALALKYLNDEQLARYGYVDLKDSHQPEAPKVSEQPQGMIGEVSSSADFTLYGLNGTNLSFATLRYLQRYHLLPSNGINPVGIWRHQDEHHQANFVEAAIARGADLGNTRSPGQIDYTNDYLEGFRQGANMAMDRNGQGAKAQSSTPANKIDSVVPNAKMADAGKEVFFHQKTGDFPQVTGKTNSTGNQMAHPGKKVTPRQRSKGKQRGHQVPRDRNGHERNGNQNPSLPEKCNDERFPPGNILRDSEPKQRMHINSPKSSNILDITALRQQPKLL